MLFLSCFTGIFSYIILSLSSLAPPVIHEQNDRGQFATNEIDSAVKYVKIEPYLKQVTRNKIDSNFNYSPIINDFLKKHKDIKFRQHPSPSGGLYKWICRVMRSTDLMKFW